LSSDLSFELVEIFSEQVNREVSLNYDDKARWTIDRIKKYNFDECLYTKVDGSIVNMTFNKWYGDFLRIGINSFTLKDYRNLVFRPIWQENGYMDLTHERHKKNARGYFCTFYAKNRKIKSVVNMLSRNKEKRAFSFGGQRSGWLTSFKIYQTEPILFRNVPQYISYCNNIHDLLTNLKALNEILINDNI
jgi:hypothetical protein